MILLQNFNYGQPIFLSNRTNTVYLENYVNIGTYVTTVVAYDSMQYELIKSYEIIWQPPIGMNSLGLFRIERQTGIVTLSTPLDPTINFSLSKAIATITVRAQSPSGVTSDINIYVDYSKLAENTIYSRLCFDPSVSGVF